MARRTNTIAIAASQLLHSASSISMYFEAMMRTPFAILLMLFATAPGFADQSVDTRSKTTTVQRAKATQPKQPMKANPCSEFGAGFVQLEGSTTCVRIGGAFGIGAASGSRY